MLYKKYSSNINKSTNINTLYSDKVNDETIKLIEIIILLSNQIDINISDIYNTNSVNIKNYILRSLSLYENIENILNANNMNSDFEKLKDALSSFYPKEVKKYCKKHKSEKFNL
jgi:ferredoxin-fold anticodon binding domain-containing protein